MPSFRNNKKQINLQYVKYKIQNAIKFVYNSVQYLKKENFLFNIKIIKAFYIKQQRILNNCYNQSINLLFSIKQMLQ
ncbi:unnamed protein product [Paramecium primaurelia]|uniref:Uncharacterized protein n=1 Tax=Paramecium primaurelia TaxID=5886 RepID=A0A8S1KQ86_PARPR|nr:unnamed protein product [Paramecium primaurelia]